MMGLFKKERYYDAFWANDIGSNLPQNNIKHIYNVNVTHTHVEKVEDCKIWDKIRKIDPKNFSFLTLHLFICPA